MCISSELENINVEAVSVTVNTIAFFTQNG